MLDLKAAEAQYEALSAKKAFEGHPKVIQYKEFLNEELARFNKKKESMEQKKKEFFDL